MAVEAEIGRDQYWKSGERRKEFNSILLKILVSSNAKVIMSSRVGFQMLQGSQTHGWIILWKKQRSLGNLADEMVLSG